MSTNTTLTTGTGTAELVFVPTPGMGHLKSTVELAKLIIQRHHNISIVILIINLPITTSLINAFVHFQSRHNPYPTRLTFITLPNLSDPPERSSPDFIRVIIDLHKPLVKEAVEDRIRAGSSLSGFVLDMFCITMIDIATDLKVPSYIFFTSGANMLSLMLHIQTLNDEKVLDFTKEDIDPNAEFDVPGFVNRVPEKVLPSAFLDKEHGVPMLLNITRGFRKSKGILVNTFTELESSGVKALLDQANQGSIPAIYPVGPILELDSGSQGEDHVSILQWLDEQPSSSVVFLCFGSMGSFNAGEVKEIANGLEKSGHRFLWSLRKPPAEGTMQPQNETFVDALPEGFLDRTDKIGKIISWAPQVSILAHSSIGGFVSHCGWNSTLESIWFGVPIAAWPLYAEQQLNAFELVKELGLAVEIRMDYRRGWKTRNEANFVVTAEEIENGVNKLMSLDEETKKRVRQMRDEGRKALEDGGSSHMSLARFIESVLTFE
ncbi:hypothetical protein BVRB_6g138370 [Beta vulgaris subsp. vulgaris]|nr:hypothetical protein BVRB_6g138370 [Beta vulgaris subsp. vulgaris]